MYIPLPHYDRCYGVEFVKHENLLLEKIFKIEYEQRTQGYTEARSLSHARAERDYYFHIRTLWEEEVIVTNRNGEEYYNPWKDDKWFVYPHPGETKFYNEITEQ